MMWSKAKHVVEEFVAAVPQVNPVTADVADGGGDVEDVLEKRQIGLACLLAIYLKHAPSRPGVHRRIHVAELPLISGKLAVRVHVPLAREQDELLLGEFSVDLRQRNAMKRQVPRGV